MAPKRAYKLQEFVAHASNVNCLKIGRRMSRILITGGDDKKVNLWAIGKPSAILSFSGLTSPVESVSFDSSELMIAAGGASGTIKIWDVKDAKVVRTSTGHRSNCTSIDFHPFGEFFASGSSDTNMKIWDMRKKGCIHTYKGHTRQINVLRFSPDGRWIVSGGVDNSVKIWDLTAGKLLTDFTFHEGPVNCIDFHPHEFLLATGSADKTVKFWDLETFELIGSSGPENTREFFVPASVVRSMTFNSDGKTLLCGLHESLKVLSWEPVVCHDVVDVGWSTLADLNVHEGKLLGCSYNQSCVGIWVVDLTQIEPYAVNGGEANSNKSTNKPVESDNSMSSVLGRLSVSKSAAAASGSAPDATHRSLISPSKTIPIPATADVTKRSSKTPGTTNLQSAAYDAFCSTSPKGKLNVDAVTDQRGESADLVPVAAPRIRSEVGLSTNPAALSHNSLSSGVVRYRSSADLNANIGKECFAPVIVPRHGSKVDPGAYRSKYSGAELPPVVRCNTSKGDLATDPGNEDNLVLMIVPRRSRVDSDADPGRETDDVDIISESSSRVNSASGFGRGGAETGGVLPYISQSKSIRLQRKFVRDALDRESINQRTLSVFAESVESNEVGNWYSNSVIEKPTAARERNLGLVKNNFNRNFGLSQMMEPAESYTNEYRASTANCERSRYSPTFEGQRGHSLTAGEHTVSADDEDAISHLMQNHEEFLTIGRCRLTKLEVVFRHWQSNDVKGAVNAMERMSDPAVCSDVVSVLMENGDNVTLDLCTSLLPLLSRLLESRFDRHLGIALQMLLRLVKSFGPIICSTLSAAAPVGVDLEAEQRLERCNLCFLELDKINASLPSIIRRRGEIGRSAEELSLFLQDISRVTKDSNSRIQRPFPR